MMIDQFDHLNAQQKNDLNSLTAMDGHDCPLLN